MFILAALLCVGATLLAFGASVTYGFLMFDDPYLVVNNLTSHGPTLRHIVAAFTSYDPELYIPLTFVSYQLNYLFAGLDPVMYHITNFVLHGLNAFLFGCIVLLILRREKLALFFGLLYAVHPLNTEAAVWIAARKDTLSTLFLFSSIVTYLSSRETGSRKSRSWSIVLYALASLSKASVFTLPLLLPLLDLLRDRQAFSWKKSARAMVPFLAIALATAVIALTGKLRVIGSSTVLETVLMAGKSTVFYLEKILWPVNLTTLYPYQKTITMLSPDFAIPAAIILILLVAVIIALRVTIWPAVTGLLFIITLAPSYFNFHKGTEMFFAVDRYAYVAMAWILLLIAKGVTEAEKRGKWLPQGLAVLGVATIFTAVVLSREQAKTWRNDETVFSHALQFFPESVTARVSLSVWFRESGRMADERAILEEGLPYSRHTALLLGLGSVSLREGKPAEAEQFFKEAMTADPQNPEPYFYLASLDEDRGRTDEAIAGYYKAIALDTSYVSAYNNLGAILLDRRELPEAEKLLQAAVKWNPNFMEGRMNLFQTLELQRKTDEAFPHLEAAYELSPDNPDILLDYGYRLSTRKRTSEAIRVLTHLLEIDPTNHTAQRILQQLVPGWKPAEIQAPRASGNMAPL